MEDDLYVLP